MADAAPQADDDLAQIRAVGAGVVRRLPGRILAPARPRARLPDRVRRRAHQGRLPGRADPRAVRRQRAHRCRRPPPSWRRSRPPAATAPPAMPRCTRWARCCATAAPSRRRAGCRASPRASCGCRHSASPSRARAPTRSICAPPRCARAITTSSTARRSGPRARSIPICCCCSRAPPPREQTQRRTEGLSVFLVDMRLAQGTVAAPASASTRSAP